jgi:hypothetical protein
MDELTFLDRQAEILSRVPPQFDEALSKLAYDMGHANGYNEILSILEDLVLALEKPIEDYREHIEICCITH